MQALVCHLCSSYSARKPGLIVEAPAWQGCRWRPAGAKALCVNICMWRGSLEAMGLWGLNTAVICQSPSRNLLARKSQASGTEQFRYCECELSILPGKHASKLRCVQLGLEGQWGHWARLVVWRLSVLCRGDWSSLAIISRSPWLCRHDFI